MALKNAAAIVKCFIACQSLRPAFIGGPQGLLPQQKIIVLEAFTVPFLMSMINLLLQVQIQLRLLQSLIGILCETCVSEERIIEGKADLVHLVSCSMLIQISDICGACHNHFCKVWPGC